MPFSICILLVENKWILCPTAGINNNNVWGLRWKPYIVLLTFGFWRCGWRFTDVSANVAVAIFKVNVFLWFKKTYVKQNAAQGCEGPGFYLIGELACRWKMLMWWIRNLETTRKENTNKIHVLALQRIVNTILSDNNTIFIIYGSEARHFKN